MVLPEEYAKNAGVNKKVVGKMTDELGKGYVTEFVALAPKVYAFQQINIDKTLSEEKKLRVQRKWLLKKCLALINTESVYSIMKRLNAYNIGYKALHTLLVLLK